MKGIVFVGFVLVLMAIAGCSAPDVSRTTKTFTDADWPFYGRDQAGTKFSPLATIDRSNVAALEVAWTWETGERPLDGPARPVRNQTV